jgi:chromosome partitioning protein
LLIDGDEQASAATFGQIRAELALPSGAFTTVQLQGAAIRQQVKALRAKYPEIVIDVGGRDTGSLRAPLTVADAILVPFLPRSVDLWAGTQIAAPRRAPSTNPCAYAVINAADAQGRNNDDPIAALRTLKSLEALAFVVIRRKAFPNSSPSPMRLYPKPPEWTS